MNPFQQRTNVGPPMPRTYYGMYFILGGDEEERCLGGERQVPPTLYERGVYTRQVEVKVDGMPAKRKKA